MRNSHGVSVLKLIAAGVGLGAIWFGAAVLISTALIVAAGNP